MAPNISQVGGGPAVGLAKDFTSWLDNALTTGSFGLGNSGMQANNANPVGDTTGIAGVLNDILAGGAGKLGGSINQLISQHQTQDVGDLRARFGAGGGQSLGTPAAFAEASYRAKAAPEAATAIGNLQLNALLPILQMIAGLSGKGISQRETLASPNPWLSGLTALAGGATGAGNLLTGINAGKGGT